jgi:coenzyme PQQ precursor peptide PqqA
LCAIPPPHANGKRVALSRDPAALRRPLRCTTFLSMMRVPQTARHNEEETIMAWTTPTLVEICIGLEINGYLPAEF